MGNGPAEWAIQAAVDHDAALAIEQPDSPMQDEVADVQPDLPMHPAPPIPPPLLAPVPALPMTRARLLMGLTCVPGSRAWSIDATQDMLTQYATDMDISTTRVGITTLGRCYHHVTCISLFCKKGIHRGRAYHGATVIQRADHARAFNRLAGPAGGALRECGFCAFEFDNLLGHQPC